jgi:hypothetical protein
MHATLLNQQGAAQSARAEERGEILLNCADFQVSHSQEDVGCDTQLAF